MNNVLLILISELFENPLQSFCKLIQTKTMNSSFGNQDKQKIAAIDSRPLQESESSEFSVEMYLNSNAFMEKNIQVGTIVSNSIIFKRIQIPQNSTCEKQTKVKKEPSAFHNFQKHIFTLLKKNCKFNSKTFLEEQHGRCAYALWQSFLKMKSCSKKIFTILFGISLSNRLQSKIDLLTRQFQEFKTIKEAYGLEQLIKAQELLRQIVCKEMENITTQLLKKTCRVDNLEFFHIYVTWFMQNLKEGEITKRITKEQQHSLLDKEHKC